MCSPAPETHTHTHTLQTQAMKQMMGAMGGPGKPGGAPGGMPFPGGMPGGMPGACARTIHTCVSIRKRTRTSHTFTHACVDQPRQLICLNTQTHAHKHTQEACPSLVECPQASPPLPLKLLPLWMSLPLKQVCNLIHGMLLSLMVFLFAAALFKENHQRHHYPVCENAFILLLLSCVFFAFLLFLTILLNSRMDGEAVPLLHVAYCSH